MEQKETENQLLKAESAANQKTIQSRGIAALALLLGFLLIGSWAIVVYRNNRQKQKYNEEVRSSLFFLTKRSNSVFFLRETSRQGHKNTRCTSNVKSIIRECLGLPNRLRCSSNDLFLDLRKISQSVVVYEDSHLYFLAAQDGVLCLSCSACCNKCVLAAVSLDVRD